MAEAVHRLVAELDYPMVIVTAAADGERGGCLVGFSTQCSIDPLRFVVCISKRNATFRPASSAGVLAVHFLTHDDRALSELFGEQTNDDVDKFEQCAWDDGPDGVPLLRDTAGYYVGRVLQRVDVGDHEAFLLEPFDALCRRAVTPQLGFRDVRDMEPGHEA